MDTTKIKNNERLSILLDDMIIALNDWLHMYAGEFCNKKGVKETQKRISNGGGTLSYIANLSERLQNFRAETVPNPQKRDKINK